MLIVHVITTIDRGGAEKALLNLTSEQLKIGLHPVVVYLKGQADLKGDFISNGITVMDKLQGKSTFRQIFELRKLLREFGESTILHAHLPRAELLSKLALQNSPFVITRHNAEPFLPKPWGSISSYVSRFVTKNAIVVAISRAVSTFLLTSEEVGKRKENPVIYYSYPQHVSIDKNSISAKRGPYQKSRTIRLGTVARLTPQKGLLFLLLGIRHLTDAGIHVLLEIMGTGPQRELLERRIIELNLTNQVRLIGTSDNPLPFISSLDLFVLTSNYEGFGLVLLEAMDAQTPIVATNLSAIPEVLSENHPGLFKLNSLSSFCETVINLLQNESLRHYCISIQNDRLTFFRDYDQGLRYLKIYEELPMLHFS